MKVFPTPPVAATPRPSNDGSSTPDRGSASSRPSASTSGARPNEEQKPYRAHDHQPAWSADAIIASQREQTERLERLVEKLSRVVTDPKGATAAIGSPSKPSDDRQAHFDKAVQREIELGKLERTVLANGHVSYRLPLDSVRNLGYELVGKRDAFVDRGEHLEVAGSGSNHLRVATLFAARKWGNEPVVIYAEGKHLDAVIEHGVRAGLNIANEHPHNRRQGRGRTRTAGQSARARARGNVCARDP